MSFIPHCVSSACISRSASVSSISKNRNPSLRSIIHHFSHSLARFFRPLKHHLSGLAACRAWKRQELWCWEHMKGSCFVYSNWRAVQWIRRLLNGPSLRGSRTVHLWWKKVVLDRLFSEYFGFPLSISCHQCSRIFIYSLLLPEVNTLRTGSFKLFKRPFPGFLTILTLQTLN